MNHSVWLHRLLPVSLVLAFNIEAAIVEEVDDSIFTSTSSQVQSLSSGTNKTGFYPVERVVLPNGKVKVKHRQYYMGIPVDKGRAVSDVENNRYVNARGLKVRGLALDQQVTKPNLTHSRALAILKEKHFINVPAIEVLTPENEKSELIIWLDTQNVPRLIYKVSFFLAAKKPTRPHAYIDAKSGRIIKMWEGLAHIEDLATGPGGNEKVGQYTFGTDYSKFKIDKVGNTCRLETPRVKTVNLNHGKYGSSAFSYACNDSNNFNSFKAINGAFSPLNDAHFFGQLVFDMYQEWLGIPPLTFQLVMRVHYGNNYENAFWNGSSMTFGDGYSRFYPLVDVNVSAHEVSHGFTDQNSDLIYSGMSGGINEAFSDVAGEAAEYYWKGDVDWQVGRAIFKSTGALRYFETPSRDGRSIDHANQYYDGLDVHYSSGVFNRAFYLLANMPDWNVKKAFEVYALANKLYWTPTTTFDQGGCGVKRASADMGYNTDDVVSAFSQVGVRSCFSATELSSGNAVSNISGVRDSERFYYFNLPQNTEAATLTLAGGSGDANLYLKYNSWPTKDNYDCASLTSNNTETCNVTLQGSGEYNVLIFGESEYANASLTLDVVESPPETLSVGQTISSLSGSRGDALFYKFALSDNVQEVKVSISGGVGDADLYLKRGNLPSKADYDCRPYYYGNDESCNAIGESSDEFYIMIDGYSSFSDVALSLIDQTNSLPPEELAVPIDILSPVSDIEGNQGDKRYYSFIINSEALINASYLAQRSLNSLTFNLSGGIGDANLYVKVGSAPSTSDYDCVSVSGSNQETCTLSRNPGTYYVMIYGAQAFQGAELSVSNQTTDSASSDVSVGSRGGGGGLPLWLVIVLSVISSCRTVASFLIGLRCFGKGLR